VTKLIVVAYRNLLLMNLESDTAKVLNSIQLVVETSAKLAI